MAGVKLDRKLQRIIGQIKFRPTLQSFQDTALTAMELENEFEEWRAVKHNDIALHSPSDKKYLHITLDSITYVNEKESATEELKEYIKKVFLKNLELFSTKEIRWVGFRTTQLLNSNFDFKELVELVHDKFCSQSSSLKSISAEELSDVVFVQDGFKNNFNNHVQIGPVRGPEALNYFRNSFKVDEDISDSALFIDIDVHLNKVTKPEEALGKLEEAIDENNRIIKEYFKYLEG